MFYFLRRIRRALLSQNKFTSYLLYAVGEIFLVVIGILLALQINELNTNRKRAKQENYLLNELIQEFEQNISMVNQDISQNTVGLDATLELLTLFQSREIEAEVRATDSLLFEFYNITGFEPVSGVIDDILNTGKLDLIKNDSLRTLLANWDYQEIDLYDDIQIRNTHLFHFLIPELSEAYPLINAKNNYVRGLDLDPLKYGKLKNSSFNFDANKFYTSRMEGYLLNHALNQEYVISGDLDYRAYLNEVLSMLKKELK